MECEITGCIGQAYQLSGKGSVRCINHAKTQFCKQTGCKKYAMFPFASCKKHKKRKERPIRNKTKKYSTGYDTCLICESKLVDTSVDLCKSCTLDINIITDAAIKDTYEKCPNCIPPSRKVKTDYCKNCGKHNKGYYRTCIEPNCFNTSCFNFNGFSRKLYCHLHKKPGMVDILNNKKCNNVGCTLTIIAEEPRCNH